MVAECFAFTKKKFERQEAAPAPSPSTTPLQNAWKALIACQNYGAGWNNSFNVRRSGVRFVFVSLESILQMSEMQLLHFWWHSPCSTQSRPTTLLHQFTFVLVFWIALHVFSFALDLNCASTCVRIVIDSASKPPALTCESAWENSKNDWVIGNKRTSVCVLLRLWLFVWGRVFYSWDVVGYGGRAATWIRGCVAKFWKSLLISWCLRLWVWVCLLAD